MLLGQHYRLLGRIDVNFIFSGQPAERLLEQIAIDIFQILPGLFHRDRAIFIQIPPDLSGGLAYFILIHTITPFRKQFPYLFRYY